MKKTISVQFDAEKLKAIQFYVEKKDISLTAELEDCVQKVYEKYVPRETREYIDSIAAEPVGKAKSAPAAAIHTSGGKKDVAQ